MSKTVLFALAGILLTEAQGAHPVSEPVIRFESIDVFVDSEDQPLAAYQFELSAAEGRITIVGVENGEHPAFAEAPYYDPGALHKENRIIIAAFSTGRELPKGRTRVASVSVRVTGKAEVDYQLNLAVAASSDGKEIPATVSFEKGERR